MKDNFFHIKFLCLKKTKKQKYIKNRIIKANKPKSFSSKHKYIWIVF